MKQKYIVTGMTCAVCSTHVANAVAKVPGVTDANVNLLQNSMTVTSGGSVASTDIIHAVEEAGYGASLASPEKSTNLKRHVTQESPVYAEQKSMKNRLITSVFFLIPLLYISMGPMIGLPLPGFLSDINHSVTYGMAQFLLTLTIIYINQSYFKRGFKSLVKLSPTMDSLIAIGASAAVIYGIYAIVQMGYGLAVQNFDLVHSYHMDIYFESAGTILTLITVGKYLESRSKGKTSDAINRLMKLAPESAIVERNGVEIEIPVEEVQVNDIVIIKTGSRVPVDGVVVEGNAAIDESAITGESIPAEKSPGSSVTGATVLSSGYIKIRAVHVGEDTALAKIIRLVEDASASKAPIARMADKVSAVFVPIVISIAIIATVVWFLLGHPLSFALSIGISVLVISCPCALGLATPTAIMVGTGKGAEQGILFKSAESIETAHTVHAVVLDKTGTVTEGKPKVVGIHPESGVQPDTLLQLAASVEKKSEHPLGRAIIEAAEEKQLSLKEVTEFKQLPGQGIRAVLDGKTFLAGNKKMMEENDIQSSNSKDISGDISSLGQTPLFFASDGKPLGLIAIADTIKSTSRDAVAAMQNMGLEVILLTGDNAETASAIAKQAGIDNVISGVLPEEKEQEVRRLQEKGKKVAMIGDGINDAPALTRADVGIAIGAGTDIAIESADIVLMKSDLMDAVTAIQLSDATIRNIKQNLFWAFFYNALGIPLAAGVFYPLLGIKLSPMFASAAMSFSSVFVVSNALRLRFFKPKKQVKHKGSKNEPMPENIKGVKTMELKIKGMMCENCKKHVEKALSVIAGVTAVSVNLDAGTASVTADSSVAKESLTQAVSEAGYEVVSIQ